MNTFGKTLKVTIFGESHGKGVGVVIDGMMPGIIVDENAIAELLERRRPSSSWESGRREQDHFKILSGLKDNRATGAPLTLFIENSSQNSADYKEIINNPRPGHADVTADIKYRGFNDKRGGGVFSGRMTAPLVAAAAIVKNMAPKVTAEAEVVKTGKREESIRHAESAGDTLGGLVACVVKGLEPGLGEPFFYSMESAISALVFSVPGVTGIEFGAGFRAAGMYGSEYSGWLDADLRLRDSGTGGINGGITNGNDLVFRVSMRPPATLTGRQVRTVQKDTGREVDVAHSGRHDISFADRAAVVVESCAVLVAADMIASARIYGDE